MNILNELLKPVLADSFGGIMYNVANRGKYNTSAILEAFEALTAPEKSLAKSSGTINGALNFIKGN